MLAQFAEIERQLQGLEKQLHLCNQELELGAALARGQGFPGKTFRTLSTDTGLNQLAVMKTELFATNERATGTGRGESVFELLRRVDRQLRNDTAIFKLSMLTLHVHMLRSYTMMRVMRGWYDDDTPLSQARDAPDLLNELTDQLLDSIDALSATPYLRELIALMCMSSSFKRIVTGEGTVVPNPGQDLFPVLQAVLVGGGVAQYVVDARNEENQQEQKRASATQEAPKGQEAKEGQEESTQANEQANAGPALRASSG